MPVSQRVNLPFTHHNIPSGAKSHAPVDPEQHLDVTVYLRPASNELKQVIDDIVAGKRQPFTREKYQHKFGASDKDIEHMRKFADEHHLKVKHVHHAARTKIDNYDFERDGKKYSHRYQSGALSVPQTYADLITGVFGFDTRPSARPLYHRRKASAAAAATGSFNPNQVAQLYNFPTQGNGSGQTVGIIELGGGYDANQLSQYFNSLGVSPTPVVSDVSVDGGSNSPSDPNGADGEVQLDIEVVGCVAPGAKIVVYFAPNTDQGFVDAITQAVHDTTNKPSILSISWGSAESAWTSQARDSMDQAFQAAASMGVTVCVAAGDTGSQDSGTGNNVDFPASNPYVLGCGGTFLQGKGNQITSETVWDDNPTSSATGGGVSQVYSLPSWQANKQVTATGQSPTALTMRGVPDVAGDADPNSGYNISVDGQTTIIGGTSAVAPLWAGLIALLNEQLGKPLGYANPTLYGLSSGFNDITSGNNGAYQAQQGWDTCTGLGSPNGAQLLNALQSSSTGTAGQSLHYQNPQNARVAQTSGLARQPEYTMITPPPNVTGSLHIGHALTFSIQDALVRWRRMKGEDVKWIPGIDHAGIGTQSVVEKDLMRRKQISRHDLGRDAFIEQVYTWKETYGNKIIDQIRKLGVSVDWERSFFTMDTLRSEAVTAAFCQLHKDRLIYRDTRLINWCCALQTAISDIEVEHETIQGRTLLEVPSGPEKVEFGVLHEFAYPLEHPAEDIKELVVATTRVETMIGDCAVAVHPEDPRYRNVQGKFLIHPITGARIPIIADAHLVDPHFGTGAVKITPAHDANDYACARRHGLAFTSIFDLRGRVTLNIPQLQGQDRFLARKLVINRLKELGLYRGKDESYCMSVARCSRSGDIIEPMLQPQWFVRVGDLARRVLKAVDEGKMSLIPGYHKDELQRWLGDTQDWCISRQLWWGHRIPAYRLELDLPSPSPLEVPSWVVAPTLEEAHVQVRDFLQSANLPSTSSYTLRQDEDVLDTWFSSALLPLSALGWKGGNGIPDRYPLSLMETGFDILFFWVARMAMLCTYFVDEPPFNDILLHAMVRDSQGRKMSKSLGNVIDPLHIIHGVSLDTMIQNLEASNLSKTEQQRSAKLLQAEYPLGIQPLGSDALRLALLEYTQQAKVTSASQFGNKIWNLVKFGKTHFGDRSRSQLEMNSSKVQDSLLASFALSRLSATVKNVDVAMNHYNIREAVDAVRTFIQEDLCDTFVEFSKFSISQEPSLISVLYHCVETSMRLLHPFMPYITEELWNHLPKLTQESSSLMLASYPQYQDFSQWSNETAEVEFKSLLEIIHAVRSLRQNNGLSLSTKTSTKVVSTEPDFMAPQKPLQRYFNEVVKFTHSSQLELLRVDRFDADPYHAQGCAVKEVSPTLKVYIPYESIRQHSPSDANKRLIAKRKLEKVMADISNLEHRMQDPNYDNRVPETVKQKNSRRLESLHAQRDSIQQNLRLYSD
ncbi:hypothetical protein BZG36_00790 [Bifiguratus adelaidae]|uniref:valine--tRNA ligase n=1 Tax=Bifiguratus adelaidae TaxID=1938954 RepID=A0A261Y6Q4_9FUNG|nr:hypothetical protein BZG36_00790 [Bifiguratus adelaidae]